MVSELNEAASSTASQTITTAASGVRVIWACCPLMPKEIWLNAISIDPIAAMAAVRLIRLTARILPIRIWPRGAGVSSRLSSVLRSRSPAELSRAADNPPVRLIVIRM